MQQHRGEVVEKVVRNGGISIKKIAERLKISRGTLYCKFREPELSYEFIKKIGNILYYDFEMHFSELNSEDGEVSEGFLQYTNDKNIKLLQQAAQPPLERVHRSR